MCRISGPISDLLNQNLCLKRLPGGFKLEKPCSRRRSYRSFSYSIKRKTVLYHQTISIISNILLNFPQIFMLNHIDLNHSWELVILIFCHFYKTNNGKMVLTTNYLVQAMKLEEASSCILILVRYNLQRHGNVISGVFMFL